MTTLPQDGDLLREYLSQQLPAKRRRFGCADVLFLSLMTGMLIFALAIKGPELLVTYGLVSVETMTRVLNVEAAPTNGETVSPFTPAQPPQSLGQPVYVPAPALPDCASVTDTRTACVQDGVSNTYTNDPTPTAEPTPTAASGGFWTAEELAAFTATAEAFYDPQTLPTAPPAFATAVVEGCGDAELRAQSPLLDSWCKPLDE